MRFFVIQDLQHWILGFFLGLVLVIAVYITWKGYPRDRETVEYPELEESEIPQSEHHPVSPLLVLLYAGVALWVLGYLIVIGIFGGQII